MYGNDGAGRYYLHHSSAKAKTSYSRQYSAELESRSVMWHVQVARDLSLDLIAVVAPYVVTHNLSPLCEDKLHGVFFKINHSSLLLF